MKQIVRRLPSTLYSVPFLACVLALVLAASYLLAANGLAGLFSAELFNTPRGVLLLVVGPLALIAFLALLLWLAVSDSLRHEGPSRYARRLFLSFCLVVFCSSFPQTVIVARFVSEALHTWFSSEVTASLEAASDLADLYESERLRLIEGVSNRFLNGLSIVNYRARPVDWMSQIRSIDPDAAACQVYEVTGFDEAGRERYLPVMETGDSSQFVPRERLDSVRDGIFSLGADEGVYRYGQTVRYANATYVCAYTSRVPAGFAARLETVRRAREQSRVIDTLKPYLPLMGAWIYLAFVFPSVLAVVILSFSMSSRLADPVRALNEAISRLSEGDSSWRLVPQGRDELAASASRLNAIVESAVAAKRADKKAIITL